MKSASARNRTDGNSAMLLLFYMISGVRAITWSGQCVIDDPSRLLDNENRMAKTNTPQVCMDYCASNAYAFAGVQAWQWCWCGQTSPPTSVIRQDGECHQNCPGDNTKFCGAPWRMNVYETTPTTTTVRSGYDYLYFPLYTQLFTFKVKSKNDVHVALSADAIGSNVNEIVIGGWGNSHSTIRRGTQGSSISGDLTSTPQIVSPTEFRGFWITTETDNGKRVIKVGKDGESSPFMTGVDNNPLQHIYVGLAGWGNAPATYVFPTPTKPTTTTKSCGVKSVVSGDIYNLPPHFHVDNIFTQNKEETSFEGYWLAPEHTQGNFIINLGCQLTFHSIKIVNTHNEIHRDRSTKKFRLSVSTTQAGPWRKVLETALEDSRQQVDPLPVQKINLQSKADGQFLKFELLEWYGRGGGLQFFDINQDNTLSATCDDAMKIYFDGVMKYNSFNCYEEWSKVVELAVPKNIKVLAIECLNHHCEGPRGILASTSDGLLSSENWICSGNQELEVWAEPGFTENNGDFRAAINFSINEAPWGHRPKISKEAAWIWGENKTSDWAGCRKVIGTSVFATCQNMMKIYFDGVLQYEDTEPNLGATTELVIPWGTKVLGIECHGQGEAKGILASLSDGRITDDTWTCSSNENLVGWEEPQFEDANGDFTAPSILNQSSRPNISNNADWIWGNKDSAYAACKKEIDATEEECLSDVLVATGNPTCCKEYKSVFRKFPNCCKELVFGNDWNWVCWENVIPVGRKRRSDNLSRKKRQNIREICYCPRKMRRGWTKRIPECCKHPVRKFMNANHPFLYDAECVALGLPSVG